MNPQPLQAHGLAEAYLYLMATPCTRCGRGPLQGENARPIAGTAVLTVTIQGRCGHCGIDTQFTFQLPGDRLDLARQANGTVLARVNPTARHSELIDLAQWLMLFRMITEAAARQTDRIEARRLGYEAAQCLEEALKFYEAENDLPPDSAFFHESSRAVRREHPQEFSRQRLVELRAKLPSLEAMEALDQRTRQRRTKRWWIPWRR